MDPASAFSLAAAVLQVVDFSSKVIKRTKEVYRSADGAIEEHRLLEDATANLAELLEEFKKKLNEERERAKRLDEKREQAWGRGQAHPPRKISTAEKQLDRLREESRDVANTLHQVLTDVKRTKSGHDRNPFDQGLRSVFIQKRLSELKERLDLIRKQFDTTLLVTLKVNSVESPTKSSDDDDQRTAVLREVEMNRWDPSRERDVAQFSLMLQSKVIDQDVETGFCKMILARLFFTEMDHRYEAIPEAYKTTFSWLFHQDGRSDDAEWDSYTDWLSASDGRNIYWITGKPGSGKSTLMKYLSQEPLTTTHLLHAWAKQTQLVCVSFYLWNSGTAMQMSRIGLLQSLLYAALKNDRATLLHLFQERFQQYIAFGGGRQPFVWLELKDVFTAMLSAPLVPTKFFMIIDGLDEFDGKPADIIELILELAQHSHVKLCVASRPWIEFSDAFEDRPNLLLERLTKQDIHRYVTGRFGKDKHYAKLLIHEPDYAEKIVRDLIDKAEGVFLWVHLVVLSLLEGLSNADRMSDLAARLEALPRGLERLYKKLCSTLEPHHFKHACQIFRLIEAIGRVCPVLHLWFADNEDNRSAMEQKIEVLSNSEMLYRMELMKRRLISRCRGLLEVTRSDPVDEFPWKDVCVGWAHRTARDYITSKAVWNIVLETTEHDAFDLTSHKANALMGIFKAVPDSADAKWRQFMGCVFLALQAESQLKHCDVEYLEEVGRTAMVICVLYLRGAHLKFSRLDVRKPLEFLTFLDLAVWLRLVSYVQFKAPLVTREDLHHAARFRDLPMSEEVSNSEFPGWIPTDDATRAAIANICTRKQLDKVLDEALRGHDKDQRRSKLDYFKRRFLGS
ncbi:hypothetical protein T440DRAFT_438724 [Plenodomus tracheiphilus IPT5]|uniref:Uncharacterized protein n=1 Tax=Plenodomus tracheiphilus IPT5 TaxID=1408161 RepID=A0A6A7BKT6_9PLEO|nr:hypothetical protein T440DRAFT_438724 [Plenodomus tracheiphilus IPT5]